MKRPEWSTLQQSKIIKGHMVNFKSITNPGWVSDKEAPPNSLREETRKALADLVTEV